MYIFLPLNFPISAKTHIKSGKLPLAAVWFSRHLCVEAASRFVCRPLRSPLFVLACFACVGCSPADDLVHRLEQQERERQERERQERERQERERQERERQERERLERERQAAAGE